MSGRRSSDEAEQGGAMPPWLIVQRARAVTRWWNTRHPERFVPVEWVEEAAHAFAMAEVRGATVEALEWQRRGLEFTERLPLELLEAICNGKDLG